MGVSVKKVKSFGVKIFSLAIVFLLSVGLLMACGANSAEQSYLRIHVRANSNSIEDQNVKYYVKDAIVDFLTPIVENVSSVQELKDLLSSKTNDMQNVANNVLLQKGFSYKSNIKINNEFFPTRYYDGVLLEAVYYDAIIVGLGAATGDNWWCVVYPPLCFVDASSTGANNFVYKSKITEIINNFFK